MNNNLHLPSYDTKWRFCSYWHQIDEILKCFPENILQIGIGNKFLHDYLKKLSINILSADIDQELKPDIIANATQLPFKDNAYDAVVAFEVLEHLPFKDAIYALSELHRVARHKVLLSLPNINPYFVLNISIPFYGTVRRLFTHSLSFKENVKVSENHCWEIGLKDYPMNKIKQNIQTAGFSIENHYRVFENPYHSFFILKKLP